MNNQSEIKILKNKLNYLQNVHQLDSTAITSLKERNPSLDDQRFVVLNGITCHSKSHLIYFHALMAKKDDGLNSHMHYSFDKMRTSQLTSEQAVTYPEFDYQFVFTYDEIKQISPERPYTLIAVGDDRELFKKKLKHYALGQLQKLQYQALSHTFRKN